MLLFCASDAGGMRQVQPLIEAMSKKSWSCCVVGSSVTVPLFAEANITVREMSIHSMQEAQVFLETQNIHVLVVGTTGCIGNEQYLTAGARQLGIPSVAILDEWYNYALRFADERGALGTYLPDILCAQDELSARLATEEGLPRERLYVTGNPALAELTQRAWAFAEDPPERPQEFLDCGDRVSLLFLSQPLRRAYGAAPGTRGAFGAFLGYDEDTVRSDLAEILGTLSQDVCVLEKLHPSETGKTPPETGKYVHWRVDRGSVPLWPLLWHADVIIGMSTKGLLEAAILGRLPVSYQPNALRPLLCTAARMGVAELHTSKETLRKRLPQLLAERGHRRGILELPCAHPSSIGQIVSILEKEMEHCTPPGRAIE